MVWPICLGQLRADPGSYFDRVAAGESIDIVRRGKLVAHLVPAITGRQERRPVSPIACPWILLSHLRKQPARYLDRVAAGETIGIVRDGELVARIVSAVTD